MGGSLSLINWISFELTFAIYDHRMEKVGNEWEKEIRIEKEGQFNFCFKDSANNWDNNNGLNWSYTIKGR
ncbi:MAG TPA: hypothetical protein GXX21_03700 [Syntrophomonadaceae bacterium]|nr:hypothetical protein [Syntrophomonadaceae bacterium]